MEHNDFHGRETTVSSISIPRPLKKTLLCAYPVPHKCVVGLSSQEEGFLAFLGIVGEGLGSARAPAAVLPVGALPWVLECSPGPMKFSIFSPHEFPDGAWL